MMHEVWMREALKLAREAQMAGAIVGAVVLGIISNILNLLGVDSYVQQIINGAIIVLAVGLDTFTRSLRVSQ